MTILDRYIVRSILGSVLMVMAVVLILGGLFIFIDGFICHTKNLVTLFVCIIASNQFSSGLHRSAVISLEIVSKSQVLLYFQIVRFCF